jgi:hypothetical protein
MLAESTAPPSRARLSISSTLHPRLDHPAGNADAAIGVGAPAVAVVDVVFVAGV